MSWKNKVAKSTSVLLIVFGLYQTSYSAALLFFVYPYLSFDGGKAGEVLYEGMIEKAIVYYVLMVVNGFYGVSLLFKPKEQLTIIQIIGGLIIFGLNLLFVVRTPITTDPVFEFLIDLIKK